MDEKLTFWDHRVTRGKSFNMRHALSLMPIGFWPEYAERLRSFHSKEIYQFYLKHPAWRDKCREKINLVNQCETELCFRLGPFHVHHKTYKNLFDEKMEDLAILCGSCHRAKHRRGPSLMAEVLSAREF